MAKFVCNSTISFPVKIILKLVYYRGRINHNGTFLNQKELIKDDSGKGNDTSFLEQEMSCAIQFSTTIYASFRGLTYGRLFQNRR